MPETDRFGDRRGAHPCDGFTLMGATPDDSILSHLLSDPIGVVDVGRPLTTPLIELTEGCGLDCPVCCQHVSFAVVDIIGTKEGGSLPPVDTSAIGAEVFEHLVHLIGVDLGVHPAHTVRGDLREFKFETRDQGIVTTVTIDASGAIDCLLVLDPEGDIPGLVVCPTVEGLTLGDHGFECLHCLVVWYVDSIRGQRRGLWAPV